MSKAGQKIIAGLQEIVENLDYYIDRQFFLTDNQPICPKCGTIHVHLIRLNAPAMWMCQKCHHRFEEEPKNETAQS